MNFKKLFRKAEQTYTIKPGDTLSQIAKNYYNDWRLWPLILSANKQWRDPDAMPIGVTIVIPDKRTLTPQEKQMLEDNIKKWDEKKKDKQNFQKQVEPQTTTPQETSPQQEEYSSGLVDLADWNVPCKEIDSRYCHPSLAKAVIYLNQQNILKYVSEAYPPTIEHSSRAHQTGEAIDIVLLDPDLSHEVTDWLKSHGYKVLNEYVQKTENWTGDHIHIAI